MNSTSGDRPRVAAALTRLRSAGERVTPARHAVLRVLDASDHSDEHLTAEQIGLRVAELEPSIHRATVYRTLTALTEVGELTHVHLGGATTVYHLATPETEGSGHEPSTAAYGHGVEPASHAHVQCGSCGRVLDVPPGTFDGVAARLKADLGFVLDTSHAALLGRCADCS
ncbi:MAG: Fur family transcriptional regulator [Dermatophilaceae bacterium]